MLVVVAIVVVVVLVVVVVVVPGCSSPFWCQYWFRSVLFVVVVGTDVGMGIPCLPPDVIAGVVVLVVVMVHGGVIVVVVRLSVLSQSTMQVVVLELG